MTYPKLTYLLLVVVAFCLTTQLDTHAQIAIQQDLIDTKSKYVGEIPFQSDITSTGAKTYTIPLKEEMGINGLNPNLALVYNSQASDSYVGRGWNLQGIPVITRNVGSTYFDGQPRAIKMSTSDCFALDGSRILYTSDTFDDEYGSTVYETEQGNIKVKMIYKDSSVCYFEVFYPDGRKGVFGNTSNVSNQTCYPLTSLTDLDGNKISYVYASDGNSPRITSISYNNFTVNFSYKQRTDQSFHYIGGKKISYLYLLDRIVFKNGQKDLWTYSLEYDTTSSYSLLSTVRYSVGSEEVNPLRFSYGTFNTTPSYTNSKTEFTEWHETGEKMDKVKVSRGRFLADSDNDCLIVYPKAYPYWMSASSTFINRYDSGQKIYIYSNLQNAQASTPPYFLTGSGFVDVLSADLSGNQIDNIVKVNNTILNGKDRISFSVYEYKEPNILTLKYTRSYEFDTVIKNSSGIESPQPKTFYAGDFDGDGRMEILTIGAEVGGTPLTESKTYLFDLESGGIIWQGHLFDYRCGFVGKNYPDEANVYDSSDKIFPLDYNGDGIVDICHINYKGTYFYSLSTQGSGCRWDATTPESILTSSDVRNRILMPCDLNGDGLPDLLVSALRNDDKDTAWTAYYGMGNGKWEKKSFKGPEFTNEVGVGMFTLDVDRDGKDDLFLYDKRSIRYFPTSGQLPAGCAHTLSIPESSIPIPLDINSHSKSSNLVTLKDGILNAWLYCNDINSNALVRSVTDSYGVVENVSYSTIDNIGIEEGVYSVSRSDAFPYVHLQERVPVVAAITKLLGEKVIGSESISYHNGVFHRQGFGFCGFEEVRTKDIKGRTTVRKYDPYNRGTLISEKGPGFERSYEYSIKDKSPSNKIKVITLVKKEVKDLLKLTTRSTVYTYDSNGIKTKESCDFGSDNKIESTYTYFSNPKAGDGYYLGIPKTSNTVTSNTLSSVSKNESVVSIEKGKPTLIRSYINGYKISERKFSYNSKGLPTMVSECPYSSTKFLTSSFEYDSYGRLTKETDNLGRVTKYTYSPEGYVLTTTDCRNNVTSYDYDILGRPTFIVYPDSTFAYSEYIWDKSVPDALYSVKDVTVSGSISKSIYNALGQELRSGELNADNEWRYIDKEYDQYGNLIKESLPHYDSGEKIWKIYSYDSFDRILSESLDGYTILKRSYNGRTVNTEERGRSESRGYDVMDRLLYVTTRAGKVSYTLAPDGQITQITSPGNVVTSLTYDALRRRVSLNDPNTGIVKWSYDASGNISKEEYANGNTIETVYDDYGRLSKRIHPEFTTSYTYNEFGDVNTIVSDNGTSTEYGYDKYGKTISVKYSTPDKVTLTKNYTYEFGLLKSIRSISNYGTSLIEKLKYRNGHHCETIIDDTITVFRRKAENALGLLTEIQTGPYKRCYDYTSTGLPTKRSLYKGTELLQGYEYTYNPTARLMTSRKDILRDLNESFSYDLLHRLVNYGNEKVSYDTKENILSKTDVGTFNYGIKENPYALTGIVASSDIIPHTEQRIKYTSFNRPDSIIEGNYHYGMLYDGNYNRVTSTLFSGKAVGEKKFYLGDTYEQSSIAWDVMRQDTLFSKLDSLRFNPDPPVVRPFSDTRPTIATNRYVEECFYIGGDYYSAYAMLVKSNGKRKLYYLNRDVLGSITAILDNEGKVVQELSYDAWGNQRDIDTYAISPRTAIKIPLFDRGYCGHEHLPYFGLINMNARLYDPLLGRFTAPDPFVQSFDQRLNMNRYAYALNNPLAYVDEDGEMPMILIGALIGGGFNLATKIMSGQVHSFKDGLVAFGIGAVAGGVATLTGGVGFAAFGGGAAGAGGFIAGAMGGISGSVVSAPLENYANHLYFGDELMSFDDYLLNVAFSGLSGGLVNGLNATFNGRQFLTGAKGRSNLKPALAWCNEAEYSNNTGVEDIDIDALGSKMNNAKPLENHHFATNKNKTYTPIIEEITDPLGLKLKDSWNIERLPHRGRHPNKYHEWVIDKMKKIVAMPEMMGLSLAGQQQFFIQQFDLQVIQPVKLNPEMLYKRFWQSLKK